MYFIGNFEKVVTRVPAAGGCQPPEGPVLAMQEADGWFSMLGGGPERFT